MRSSPKSDFEWRATFGSLRWLILGTLGLGQACGGRTEATLEPGQSGRDTSSPRQDGGAGGSHGAIAHTAGAAGLPGAGAAPGVAGSASLAGAGGTAGTSNGQPSACVFAESLEGGMERCENGMLHRVASGSCSSLVPRPNPQLPADDWRLQADAGIYNECLQDSDCTAKPHGHCQLGQGGPYCAYGCTVDAECAADQLCLCGSPVGECIPASCRSDAECGPGLLCASSDECYFTRFSCQQPNDECAVSSDCTRPLNMCRYAELEDIDLPPPAGARRVCQSFSCPVIGRPFLVDGAERLAHAVQRADWYRGQSSPAPGLTPELARAIAAGWTEQALMEHASVAAFARFALQLLSLGAPAALVDDTARALADELRHARDCFRLARRHLPADIGPGPLPVHGALAQTSLHEIVLTTVLEGCIGETVAALEASLALAHCEDAEACAVLERIAQEEGEHAQLAWRFVAWALAAAPQAERAALLASVERAFRVELAAPASAALDGALARDFDSALARHGLLSAAVRRALRQRVLAEVVAPCAEALLARAREADGRGASASTAGEQPPAV